LWYLTKEAQNETLEWNAQTSINEHSRRNKY